MDDNAKTLTSGEFSKVTGVAVSIITRMLRQGRIRGEKHSGKWAIFESEIQNTEVVAKKDREKASAGLGPIFDTSFASGKVYDVETFVKMTYLTEKGARHWLRTGRLSGKTNADGKALIDAANLDRPELRHLVRK